MRTRARPVLRSRRQKKNEKSIRTIKRIRMATATRVIILMAIM